MRLGRVGRGEGEGATFFERQSRRREEAIASHATRSIVFFVQLGILRNQGDQRVLLTVR